MDERSLRIYLQSCSGWNSDEIDQCFVASKNNCDRSLDNHIHLPLDVRSLNLNQMVSNIIEETNGYQSCENLPIFDQSMQYVQRMRNIPYGTMKMDLSLISESGYPRNIPDSSSTQYNPPKDIQILVRQSDQMGVNSLIKNVTLQQFRQMIGLQRSSGLTRKNDGKFRHSKQSTLIHSKLSSSSINSISSPDVTNTMDLTISQDISYSLLNRRTTITNTLHLGIEKCYEQLNYIRESYVEAESKIGIPKSSFMIDMFNSNLSNNSSRIDRLIIEYQYEYNRIIRLHERIQEEFHIENIEATRQTLDEWFNAIQLVHDRRRQEINNTTETYQIGDIHVITDKDLLQLAEALRILCITTRKIRTVLWYWLYWSTNSNTIKMSLFAHYQTDNVFYPSMNDDLFNLFGSDISGKKISNIFNENNKENQYHD